MTYNPDVHHRKSVRLQEYDYSRTGMYFVTVCTQNKECLFGGIKDGEMILNEAGRMVKRCWVALKDRYKNILLDVYIVMPNHMHGIIQIVGAPLVGAHINKLATIGQIIGAFKSITTDEYIRNTTLNGWKLFNGRLWQRNFYEHIVRDEKSLEEIRNYIVHNVSRWRSDELFV